MEILLFVIIAGFAVVGLAKGFRSRRSHGPAGRRYSGGPGPHTDSLSSSHSWSDNSPQHGHHHGSDGHHGSSHDGGYSDGGSSDGGGDSGGGGD
ncbi:hypothetical protein [Actinoplanes sp. HUAS TT8]|uniref:hypothetical protein n=1 Tax=Actinoplanes sp. HUAS TT8 TaxID=3447453 RepID=UPI003F521D70